MDYEYSEKLAKEIDKMSLDESKRQTKERKEIGLNMIRPFTYDEKKLLWDGLREDKKTLHELAMEGFNEEQTLRRIEEKQELSMIEERNGF